MGLLGSHGILLSVIAHLNGGLGHEAGYVPSAIHPDWSACTLLLPARATTFNLLAFKHAHVHTAYVAAHKTVYINQG